MFSNVGVGKERNFYLFTDFEKGWNGKWNVLLRLALLLKYAAMEYSRLLLIEGAINSQILNLMVIKMFILLCILK